MKDKKKLGIRDFEEFLEANNYVISIKRKEMTIGGNKRYVIEADTNLPYRVGEMLRRFITHVTGETGWYFFEFDPVSINSHDNVIECRYFSKSFINFLRCLYKGIVIEWSVKDLSIKEYIEEVGE